MTHEKIEKLLKSNFDVNEYEIVNNKVIVHQSCLTDGSVKFYSGRLPIIFKEVKGSFVISGCNLTTLEGCPETVSTMFNCASNELSSLFGSPKIVGGSYICARNPLTSLEYLPILGSYCLLRLTISTSLPVLRLLLQTSCRISDTENKVIDILDKYRLSNSKITRKKAILDCQKELIDNGFMGNASW